MIKLTILFLTISAGLVYGYARDPVPVHYRVGKLSFSYGQHEVSQEALQVLEHALRRG